MFYWNGLSLVAHVSWLGGVRDVVLEWLRRRRVDPTPLASETAANRPADAAEWLHRAIRQRLPREDLRGLLDAVVLAAWMADDPALALSERLQRYYGLQLGPHLPGTPEVGARLDHFVAAEPMLWNGVTRTAASLGAEITASALSGWALWNVHDAALTPYVTDGTRLRPWYAAALTDLAAALVTVLLHAGAEQRTLPSWPAEPDPALRRLGSAPRRRRRHLDLRWPGASRRPGRACRRADR
ncbi:hypothetical protein ACIBI9_59240 [Nonomuraea sp. NPDC050451]|uniref:hypothetical protein n=1 Tax=Nonomuraea sp. NPDC050451 TaxID=3364364 RepID=UPI0037BC2018